MANKTHEELVREQLESPSTIQAVKSEIDKIFRSMWSKIEYLERLPLMIPLINGPVKP